MNNKFNIGDTVQITDNGHTYSIYSKMAERMNLSDFNRNTKCPLNVDLEIIAAGMHDYTQHQVVYGVKEIVTGNQYLVGDRYMVLSKPTSQYTLDDLRNKYVRVGTPEYEVFMDACEGLGITWPCGTKPRELGIDDNCVSFDAFDGNLGGDDERFYITMEEYSLFTPKQPQPVIAEETPWTIYNNTLPLEQLSDAQFGKLVREYYRGAETESFIAGSFHHCVTPTWHSDGIYRITQKSEMDEFVDKVLTFYKHGVVDEKVIDMIKEAYDNGCRFV